MRSLWKGIVELRSLNLKVFKVIKHRSLILRSKKWARMEIFIWNLDACTSNLFRVWVNLILNMNLLLFRVKFLLFLWLLVILNNCKSHFLLNSFASRAWVFLFHPFNLSPSSFYAFLYLLIEQFPTCSIIYDSVFLTKIFHQVFKIVIIIIEHLQWNDCPLILPHFNF